MKSVFDGDESSELLVPRTIQDMIVTASADERRNIRALLEQQDRDEASRLRDRAAEIVATARDALEAAETEALELEEQAEALDGKVSAPVRKEVDEPAVELETIPVGEAPKAKSGRKPKGRKAARKPAKKAKVEKAADEPAELDDHEQKVLKAISKGALGTAAVAEKCGLEQPYTARVLKKLVGRCLAVKLGDKRATRYEAA